MLFNSYVFWLFFLAVIVVYRLLPHRAQNRYLLLASYFFYGYWDWRFLSLILASTVVDYFMALKIEAAGNKHDARKFLLVSLVLNLGLLGVFKYYAFFANELLAALQPLGISASLPFLELILPVGISFYTFQTLSYTIDVYRNQTRPTRDFLDFALYVSFFPQLVAGPIERSSHLLPQVTQPRDTGGDQFRDGLYHVLFGLFKKIAIADNMGLVANSIFNTPAAELNGLEVLIGVYAFAFQIYGDFSGYSSIAVGIGRWLGFDLMHNFNQPYFAASPQEFWRRWHISLSTWLRDYLYIPLGGNRGSRIFTCRNLLITMVLGGLWHGANWTFLVWGLLHGLLLAVPRCFAGITPASRTPHYTPSITPARLLKIVLTFHLVCLSWLFFRAESLEHALALLRKLGSASWEITSLASFGGGMIVFYVAPFLIYEAWIEKKGDLLALTKAPWGWRAAAYLYFALMLFFFYASTPNEFIYFQF